MGENAVSTKSNPPRRKFLAGAALGTGVAAGFPMIARAQQPITLRWQSTWPAKDIFHEYALDYAKKVNEMSGGRLRIDVLPAGAVVRAFDLIDAVAKGTLDGGHGVSAYWYGKNSAFSLFGTGPAVGMDANNFLAWMAYGGGQALYDELVQNVLNLDVVGFVYGPMPTQPLGWFKKPVQNAAQLKGLKYRTVGLSIDVFKAMGASVNALPGGEIVPAMDRGLLDAAEFNNASSDRLLGFPDVSKVCMLQSYHQPAEAFEILFNRKRYDALPADMKSILKTASEAASADMSWKAIHRYSQDYIEMREKQGVRFFKTPDDVLRAQMGAWSTVVNEKRKENPFFAKVLDSQMAWARRTVTWSMDTMVDPRIAYNHWFGQKAAGPAKS
ncbi:MAG: TRAP transporter substrate-binding protein [Proteobacteria bacterium]|jgi:TRAP-type mannitol/chloroaromatic compound transport system substrate-binding protein|nr:TRAP transporter substrate-binding protein [Pseudomonadota bacterium]